MIFKVKDINVTASPLHLDLRPCLLHFDPGSRVQHLVHDDLQSGVLPGPSLRPASLRLAITKSNEDMREKIEI